MEPLALTPAELFVPVTVPSALAPELANDVLHQRNAREFLAIMCLAPGVSLESAEVALDAIIRRLDEQEASLAMRADKGRRVTLLEAGLTVWAWFINAILSLLIFSILLAACVFLLSTASSPAVFLAKSFLSQQPASVAQSTLLSLAAPLLVFRASRSLRRHAPVFRNRLASAFHFFPASPSGRNAQRSSLFAASGSSAFSFGASICFRADSIPGPSSFFPYWHRRQPACVRSPAQLVRYTVERQNPTQYGDALCSWVSFLFF